MTFATKNNKCYELDSFDFGRMSRTGIYLLSGKNKQGYRSREISVVIFNVEDWSAFGDRLPDILYSPLQ